MAEACREVYEYIQSSFGNDMTFLVIYAVCLVYLSFCGKRRRCQIVYPSLLITIVIICPPFYKYIWTRLMDYGYWRSFWMIPIIPVYAVTAAEIINKPFSQWGRGLFLVVIAGVVIVTGNNIYTAKDLHSTFEVVNNKYKLPDEVVAIGEALLELDDEPKVVMEPSKYYDYIRQYSSNIDVYKWDISSRISGDMIESIQSRLICAYADEHDCNYVILPEYIDVTDIEDYGYTLECKTSQYSIYKNKYLQSSERTWQVNINYENETFISVTDNFDRYGLIDGGSIENEEILRQYIKEKGIINTWLISSLNEKLSQAGVRIFVSFDSFDYIYCRQIGSIQNSSVVKKASDNLMYTKISGLSEHIHLISQCNFLGLQMKVFNDYSEEILKESSNVVDDSSMIIKFSGSSQSFLYVSNVTQTQLDKIIEQYKDELKSDYLIINNLNCTDFTGLENAVAPLETYNLQSIEKSETFSIR
jgi:hypothetical protein